MTGAERYLKDRLKDPDYKRAYDQAAQELLRTLPPVRQVEGERQQGRLAQAVDHRTAGSS